MAFRVTIAELYRAAPVLSRISKVKLHVLGAMKLNQLMTAIDAHINAIEAERMAKLKELAVLKEDGSISYHEETDERGKMVQMADYKSIEAEQEMEAFGKTMMPRVLRVPFRIKSKHLAAVAGVPNSGYTLSVEECKNLGRFLSYDDVPVEPDENIDEPEEGQE